jgi:adenylosuccinate synthase
MPATIIMGGQWGDEGKGKLTDALAAHVGMVVRANGGSNAGHTVQTDAGVFKLHLIPSGVLNPGCICVIGAGVVVEPGTLLDEMDGLAARGVDVTGVRVSERAHVVLPYHPKLDQLEESVRECDNIGTTMRGNGPAYADKVARHGIRIADLLRPELLRRRLAIELDSKNRALELLYGETQFEYSSLYRQLLEWGERLQPFVVSTEVLVQDTLAEGHEILIECAQGALLDIDYGSYPFVTSSSPTAAGACQGAGVAPTQVRRVLAVYKSYSTRVGSGPMPSELTDDVGERIRVRGREFGTTTGRPRRTGWFDGVAARHTSRLNGVTEVALTLLDVLDSFEQVRICSGYRIGDSLSRHLPALSEDLDAAAPEWLVYPGWKSDTSEILAYEHLPPEAKAYVSTLESFLAAPIRYVGVGPAREQLIDRFTPRSAASTAATPVIR